MDFTGVITNCQIFEHVSGTAAGLEPQPETFLVSDSLDHLHPFSMFLSFGWIKTRPETNIQRQAVEVEEGAQLQSETGQRDFHCPHQAEGLRPAALRLFSLILTPLTALISRRRRWGPKQNEIWISAQNNLKEPFSARKPRLFLSLSVKETNLQEESCF